MVRCTISHDVDLRPKFQARQKLTRRRVGLFLVMLCGSLLQSRDLQHCSAVRSEMLTSCSTKKLTPDHSSVSFQLCLDEGGGMILKSSHWFRKA